MLSRWWSTGLGIPENDAIFWRTSNSGGRATTRAKKGLRTFGSYGDVAAVDPIGQPLLDLLTIEIKTGYSHSTLHDLFDAPSNAAVQTYEDWIWKAEQDTIKSKSMSWMIVHRRNRRIHLVTSPAFLFQTMNFSRYPVIVPLKERRMELCVMPLWEWLQTFKPPLLVNAVTTWRKGINNEL